MQEQSPSSSLDQWKEEHGFPINDDIAPVLMWAEAEPEDEDLAENVDAEEGDDTKIASYIPSYLQNYVFPCVMSDAVDSDFCYTPFGVNNPRLIAQLMMEGFLPMAHSESIFLPKLHRQRCLIHPLASQLHISKNSRKKSRHYSITINQDLDGVIAACHAQHAPSCWLYPALVSVFRVLQQATRQSTHGYRTVARNADGSSFPVAVRFYSIEVWRQHEENEERTTTPRTLVAGEIGYAVGDCGVYTSLTGFSREDSAGAVQLATLGALLCHWQCECWDLGMALPYKERLGGRSVPRAVFSAGLHQWRRASHGATPREENAGRVTEEAPTWLPAWPVQEIDTPLSCREVLDTVRPRTPQPPKVP